MALPKITSVQSRVSTDGTQIQIAFILNSGGNWQAQLTPNELADLVGHLLQTHAAVPMRQLEADAPMTDHPVTVNGIGITPLPDSSTDAVLTLMVGRLPLQFCIPLDDLLGALRKLESETEFDPNNPRPQ